MASRVGARRSFCEGPDCGPPRHVGKSRDPLPRRWNMSHIRQDLYKTALCMNFKHQGYCLFEDRCKFAHGKRELRVPQVTARAATAPLVTVTPKHTSDFIIVEPAKDDGLSAKAVLSEKSCNTLLTDACLQPTGRASSSPQVHVWNDVCLSFQPPNVALCL